MAMVRVPGYSDYLESIDPGVRKRHADGGAPPGFTDAIGWFIPASDDSPAHWNVTFTVADADAAPPARRSSAARSCPSRWTSRGRA